MKEKNVPIGKISSDLLSKSSDPVTVVDQARAMTEDYMDNLVECAKSGVKAYSSLNKPYFFVVVLTKIERLMRNVYKNYFLHRLTCPHPNYDQTVYKYDLVNHNLELLWVVPDRNTCFTYMNSPKVVDPEELPLLEYVLKYESKELYRLAKQLNNEKDDENLDIIKEIYDK
jgi:hypothetical protein